MRYDKEWGDFVSVLYKDSPEKLQEMAVEDMRRIINFCNTIGVDPQHMFDAASILAAEDEEESQAA